MRWQAVTPSDDVEAASWIAPRLLPFNSYRVGAIVPTRYAAYARIPFDAQLAPILAQHTSTPDRCWFCLWEGYAYLTGAMAERTAWNPRGGYAPRPPSPPRLVPPPKLPAGRVQLPNRNYVLFAGSVDQGDGWQDGPNLWWPEDRSWCVASEVDLDYTLVGGSPALAEELIKAGAVATAVDEEL